MNELLTEKLNELEKSEKYECWYLVKQETDFSKLCYLVSILESYKLDDTDENLETYVKRKKLEIEAENPGLELCDTHRALRVAAMFGLILPTSTKFEESKITETFREISIRCNRQYENIETYKDIVQRQIEKVFISSSLDEKYEKVRKNYRLFPVMLLYKILLEMGISTGTYSISMSEYRYLIATTKNYESYLDTLLLIKLLRRENDEEVKKFEKYKNKLDNRLIQALRQLETLSITK